MKLLTKSLSKNGCLLKFKKEKNYLEQITIIENYGQSNKKYDREVEQEFEVYIDFKKNSLCKKIIFQMYKNSKCIYIMRLSNPLFGIIESFEENDLHSIEKEKKLEILRKMDIGLNELSGIALTLFGKIEV